MTNRPLIGLMLALIVEAKHWTRIRWEFGEETYAKAWHFTAIIIAVTGALIWLDGTRYTALPELIGWLPLLLSPMQFVQTYGMRDTMPLHTFSFLSGRRRERSLRLGLIEETKEFHFGNPYFLAILIASTLGSRSNSWIYLPAIVVFTAWMLLSGNRRRALSVIPTLMVAGVLAIAGERFLVHLEEQIGRVVRSNREQHNPNLASTMIGKSGRVEQSPDIIWRLRMPEKTIPPRLLRTSSFSLFLGQNWQNHRVANIDFNDLSTRLIGEDAYYLLQTTAQSEGLEKLPHFMLRGGATNETPLPLPGDVAGLRDFQLDGVESNSFGTVRIFPKHSVIDGTIFWRGGTNPEIPPDTPDDLRLPLVERETLRSIAANLGLDASHDLQTNFKRISNWFASDFQYTRQLSIRGSKAITQFLTTNRSGHCEYFATSATLLLRAAGIPARYSIGYAVIERDPKRNEFVVRGTHGHAWCRVWDQASGQWIDFDPTPPDWQNLLGAKPPRIQWITDSIKRMREDFFVWRNRPANRMAVTITMLSVCLVVSAFVTKRLWKSKRKLESATRGLSFDPPMVRTPLHDLETQAQKLIGIRPPGQPFGQWLGRLKAALPDLQILDEAIALHQQLRFDPQPAPPEQHNRLVVLSKEIHTALRRK